MADNIGFGVDVGGSGIKGGVVDLDTGELVGDRIKILTPQPATPDAVAETIVEQVPIVTGLPVLAWLPEGAEELDREEFLGRAAGWFSGTTTE